MAVKLSDGIQELIDRGLLKIQKDKRGNYYCLAGGSIAAYSLEDSEFRVLLKKMVLVRKCVGNSFKSVLWVI